MRRGTAGKERFWKIVCNYSLQRCKERKDKEKNFAVAASFAVKS